MSNRDIDVLKNELLKNRIELSDTISQFMEKCNNNFTAIVEWGGGPAGTKGDNGDPGAPTKPKVPIHVWREGIEYTSELEPTTGEFEIVSWHENLRNVKYQDGHLIMLKNGHVYILETDNFELKPKFILALKTYDPGDVIDGRNAYVHFAYTNDIDTFDDFITDQQIRGEAGGTESVEAIATFGLGRTTSTGSYAATSVGGKMYMGVYSDNIEGSATTPDRYTWIRVQGAAGERGVDGLKGEKGDPGEKGEPGEKGDKGDGYTGHPYVIDLEGDMATISIDIDRTRLYDASGDYCECVVHAYYGDKNVKVRATEITIKLPNEFKYSDNGNIVLASDSSKYVGNFVKSERNNDVVIKFIPHESFEFPKQTILFTIHVTTSIKDEDDGNTYNFERDTVWMVKGIVSTFELEILPQYRSIKLFDDGKYYPEYLKATVYKVEDTKRSVFNITEKENTRFTLLYKDYDSNTWLNYNDLKDKDDDGNIIGVPTNDMSCIEFKVVRDYGIPNEEEIWDYEDVWVVSDGKSVHYYHADLGGMESMMVLTTGESFVLNGDSDSDYDDPYGSDPYAKYCAELRNESGYTVMLEPKFYDGTDELTVTAVNLRSTSSDIYVYEHTFVREVGKLITEEVDGVVTYKCPFSVTRVPFGVDVLPVSFDVRATRTKEDGTTEDVNDTIGFNIYISSLKNTYTLVPSVSSYNTSTGKDGETVGCSVFKNDTIIPTTDLDLNGLTLQYIVHDGSTETKTPINYTEPLVYGDDSDIVEDEFNAEDVAIVFILSYNGNEVARSTVPLIKDGIDGRDGDTWQYIFCRSPRYPFSETGISDPSTWKWQYEENPDSEYLGASETDEITGESTYPTDVNLRWYDDHQGINAKFRYEYQSYRKWDKLAQRWGQYGSPTLYSNYSESGSGYSVLLSNPIAVIPVGSDWATDENQTNQFDSTFVYLYNNTSDISTSENVTLSLPTKEDGSEYDKTDHFSIKRDETTNTWMVTFTPVVNEIAFNFESNTQYKLPITVTYELGGNSDSDMDGDGTPDYFTSTINWTLSPIKGLDDVEVFTDKRVVNVSTTPNHTIRVGYYSISSNGGKYFVGSHEDDKNKITDSEGNITYKYEIILTEDVNADSEDLRKGIVDDWSSTEYNFTHQNDDGSISTKNCYVALAEVTNESVTIIDYINITSVQDGASAMHLELTQDYIAIPCDKDGRIHEKFGDDKDEIVMSQMILYNGDTEIKDSRIEYSFEINGDTLYVDDGYIYIDSSDSDVNEPIGIIGKDENDFGSFTFNINYLRNIIEGDTIIKCIATYAGASYSKTLIIDLEETPYELELTKNVLSRNVNKKEISDSELVVYVKYWRDGKWAYVNDGTLVVWANGIEGYTPFTNDGGKYKIDFTKNDALRTNTEAIEFRISLYKEGATIDKNTKELSYETIGIIDGGKDGEDGDGWQYIFCKSPNYPFKNTGIADPHSWYSEDDAKQLTDSNAEYIPEKQKEYWTDDHQGVDSANRYEYQSFRKWNKVDKHWTQYSSPTLYSNYSESGSGYSALLSNPIAIIPVGDNDWSVDEDNTNQADFTYVYFYDNVNDISKSIEVSIPEYSENANNDKRYRHFNVDGENDTIKKVTFTPCLKDSGEAFDFESNTQYKLPITITYSTKSAEGKDVDFSTKIDWTLTPIKGLSDVEVFVDKRVVNISEGEVHTFRVGYYTISTSGGKKFIESSDKGGNSYNIVLRDSEDGLTPGAKLNNIHENDILSDWRSVEYDFVDGEGININCYIVLIDNENTIIDYTYITSIKDGEDGASAIHLELTEDYIAVPAKADGGGVHPDFGDTEDEVISSRMVLYDGNIEIRNKKITDGSDSGKYIIEYYFQIDGQTIEHGASIEDGKPIILDIESGTFTINDTSIITGDTNIECIVEYGNGTFYKTLFIDLEETPYELEINKSILSRKVATVDESGETIGSHIVDDSITVRPKYWKRGNWQYIYQDGAKECSVKASIGGNSFDFNNYSVNAENIPEYTLNITSDNFKGNIDATEVEISYYENGEKLSYEFIGIINNGVDGINGKDGEDGEDGLDAIHLELSPDYIPVPANATGDGIHSDYKGDIRTQMLLYSGDTIIDPKSIKYSFEISENEYNDSDVPIIDTETYVDNTDNTNKYIQSITDSGIVVINKNKITVDTSIKCIATYKETDFYNTLLIDIEDTPYKLQLNKTVLIRNITTSEGGTTTCTIVDENIIARAMYWLNGSWRSVSFGKGSNAVVQAKIGDATKKFVLINTGDPYTTILNIDGNDGWEYLKYNKDYSEVVISLLLNDKEISNETIGIVNNGEKGDKGSAPSCLGVEILGYSKIELSIDADITETGKDSNGEDCWYKTLNALQSSLTAGQKIYMLNKYTWSDNTTTKGITVTLAGTQGAPGAKGESRVLFYLGSYQDGTLKETDTVVGYLTSTRCDYFIDKKGQAWMRKEVNGVNYESCNADPNGFTDSHAYRDYWEKSEKVGFLQARAIHAEMINTASIIADKAFVSEFQAVDILADTIKGHTLQSDKEVSLNHVAKEGPAWQLNNAGDGYLAQGNISWDSNGIVSFTENVQLKWGDNIADKPNIPTESNINEWATEITKEYIKAYQISASNFKGGTFEGVTFQSSTENGIDPAWQLNVNGAGHLAKGNIYWNDDGVVTFSSKVKLQWSNIDENGMKIDGTKITENSISTQQINVDSLFANNIFVDKIKAVELNADKITSGTINAGLINTNELVVKKLNTKPNYSNSGEHTSDGLSSAQVRIQDNEIVVTGNLMENTGGPTDLGHIKKVLHISGDKFDNDKLNLKNFDIVTQTTVTSVDPIGDKGEPYIIFAHSSTDPTLGNSHRGDFPWCSRYKICDVKDLVSLYPSPNDVSANLNILDSSISNKIRLFSNLTTDTDERIKCRVRIITDPKDLYPSLITLSIGIGCVVNNSGDGNINDVQERMYSVKRLNIWDGKFKPNNTFEGNITNAGDITDGYIDIFIPFETTCLKSEYEKSSIYLIVKCETFVGEGTLKIKLEDVDENTRAGIFQMSNGENYIKNFTFSSKQLINNLANVNINRDCFRYFVDDYNYFNLDDNGYLTYYFMNSLYGIGSDENGLWIKIGDYKEYVSNLNDALSQAKKNADALNSKIDTEVGKLGSDFTSIKTVEIAGIKKSLFGTPDFDFSSSDPEEATGGLIFTWGNKWKETDKSLATLDRDASKSLALIQGGTYKDENGKEVTVDVGKSLQTNTSKAVSMATSADSAAKTATATASAAKSTAESTQSNFNNFTETAVTFSNFGEKFSSAVQNDPKIVTTDNAEQKLESTFATKSSVPTKMSDLTDYNDVTNKFQPKALVLSNGILVELNLLTIFSTNIVALISQGSSALTKQTFTRFTSLSKPTVNISLNNKYYLESDVLTIYVKSDCTGLIIPAFKMGNYIVKPIITADFADSKSALFGNGLMITEDKFTTYLSVNTNKLEVILEVSNMNDNSVKFFTVYVIVQKTS